MISNMILSFKLKVPSFRSQKEMLSPRGLSSFDAKSVSQTDILSVDLYLEEGEGRWLEAVGGEWERWTKQSGGSDTRNKKLYGYSDNPNSNTESSKELYLVGNQASEYQSLHL